MENGWKSLVGFGAVAMCLAAAVTGTVAFAAGMPEPPTGQWSGQNMLDAGTAQARPMAVNLMLADRHGDISGTLQLGSPKQCRADLKDVTQAADGSWLLSVTNANGGGCDALIGQKLKLALPSNDTLAFEIAGISGQLLPAEKYRVLAWNGDWTDPASPETGSPLRVHLEASRPGGQASGWRYGAPRSCNLTAEYSGAVDGAVYFAFTNANGGYCNSLIGGYVKMDAGSGGAVDYYMYSPVRLLLKEGRLQRARE